MKPYTASRLVLPFCSLLWVPACAGSGKPASLPEAKGPVPTSHAPQLSELICSMPEPEAGVIYLSGQANSEWGRKLEEHRSTGSVLAVKQDDQGIKVVDCRISGSYAYASHPLQQSRCATSDPNALETKAPLWLAELGGKLEQGQVATVEVATAGIWSISPSATFCPKDIDECSGATHLVERVDVGAYASFLARRDWFTAGTSITALPAAPSGKTAWTEKVQGLNQAGSLDACTASAKGRLEPNSDCSMPVAVKLTPLRDARNRLFKPSQGASPLALHVGTPSLQLFCFNGPEEIERMAKVKNCKPELNNCFTIESKRQADLPIGAMFVSAPQDFRCGGKLFVEGEYWIESNTFREPGLKLCAIGSNPEALQHCQAIANLKQTMVNRKSSWKTDPWPKFRAEISVPQGAYSAALAIDDAGNFGTYLRNVSFAAR